MRLLRWGWAVLAVCAGAVAGPARADVKGLEDLLALFKVDAPQADIVILLDASGSMTGKNGPVKEAVAAFCGQLGPRDNLFLQKFAGDVAVAIEGPGDEEARKVAPYIADLLPGRNTDLGKALHKGLAWMERPQASPVQVLFLLTDGMHQPPPGSPYEVGFGGPAWADLRTRAEALCKKNRVLAYGFGLGSETDIELLSRVFPYNLPEVVEGQGGDRVPAVLSQLRRRLREWQLRESLEAELRAGKVSVQWSKVVAQQKPRGFTAHVTVRNDYAHLPVTLSEVAVTPHLKGEGDWTLSAAPRLGAAPLAPGAVWEADLKAAPRLTLARSLLERHLSLTGDISCAPSAAFPHRDLLVDLKLPPEPRALPAAAPAKLDFQEGAPWWAWAGLAAGIGAAIVGFITRTRHEDAGFLGTLVGPGKAYPLEGADGPEVHIGPGQAIPAAGVAQPDGRPAPPGVMATLRMTEDGRNTHLTLEALHPSVRVNQQMLTGPQSLNAGDRITVGESRFTVSGEVSKQVRFARPLVLIAGLAATLGFAVVVATQL